MMTTGIKHIEVSPVSVDQQGRITVTSKDAAPKNEVNAWAVYRRRHDGLVTHIRDYASEAEALAFAQRLADTAQSYQTSEWGLARPPKVVWGPSQPLLREHPPKNQ